MAGSVTVNQQPADKPGRWVGRDDAVGLKSGEIPYVSRGGLKLQEAIERIGIDVRDWVCMDVGASTGGFTDCLLQHGAARVYAVDVGYGQLAWQLRQDGRVVVIERSNIRYLAREAIGRPVDLVTIDVSFISLKIVVPAVVKFMKPAGKVLALIKPQFEVGRGRVGKGGVVRSAEMQQQVVSELTDFFRERDLIPQEVIPSPILGPKGNQEYVIFLKLPEG